MEETDALGRRVMRRLDELARCTDVPGELTRLYLTPAHKAAAGQVSAWMAEAGMAVRFDAAATVIGRYEGVRPAQPALLLGSHIDTVRNAGRYDGTLGVVTAIEAVAALHRKGERLPFAIEVLAFGDEEGVRFPATLTGSRALAGTLDPAVLGQRDADGSSLREALIGFGCDPTAIARVARRPDEVLGYVEVHIEQGPMLDDQGLPLGVVTAINGASRFRVEVTGEAGHAGTVPMVLRRDALLAAAEMVLAVPMQVGRSYDLVATVGQIEVLPGAPNVIPGLCRFSLDVRSATDPAREQAIERITAQFREIAKRRDSGLHMVRTYDEPAAACDPGLIEALSASVARQGVGPLRLSSGAGHDGLAMAPLCPIAMLFVRCEGGISHNPAESIMAEDAGLAVAALLDFLRTVDLRGSRA